MKTSWVATVVLVLFAAVTSDAQTTVLCPPDPNLVTVKVASQVTFDATTKMFTYTYTVSNDPSSAQEIRRFDLDFAPPVSNFTNPHGWVHGTLSYRSTLGWAAIDDMARPADPADKATVPAALSQIKPGQSVTGFSFQSPKPPGPVKYFVTGYVIVPAQQSEDDAEMLSTDCLRLHKKVPDIAVVGTTQGPVDFIPVNIEIKPPSAPPVSVNPRAQGDTPVAILGSATFQVSSIDTASLRLGPGGSTPSPNQVHFEDVNGDGIMDLVAQFPTQMIGIRCNDAALFLTGKTTSGVGIQGSEELQTVGCQSGQPKSGLQPVRPPK
jgi:hypothetical protein